ncbi:hypothetical protein D4R51_02295 [bacterium]|nr:MAG: hypothetical protein D4R51_02295 [bacterium]
MKRLWLKIPGFLINGIHPFDSKDGKSISIDMLLGKALDVRGVVITKCPDGMTQNWAMANTRFFDVPILHKKTRKRNPLLHDVLAIILVIECWTKLAELFLNGLDGKELEYVRPWMWLKQSLRIPVDFIQLQNFRSAFEGREVYADFRVGHHFIVWQVLVYSGSKFVFDPVDKKVVSDELRALAERLMKRRTLRQTILSVSKRDSMEMGKKFTLFLKHCDPEGIPPAIRFY